MDIIKTLFVDHPIDVAARSIGGRVQLAEVLGVSVTAIGNWKSRGVPLEHCSRIEAASNGIVTRRDLRPDDWQKIWPELAQAQASQAQPATQTAAQGA